MQLNAVHEEKRRASQPWVEPEGARSTTDNISSQQARCPITQVTAGHPGWGSQRAESISHRSEATAQEQRSCQVRAPNPPCSVSSSGGKYKKFQGSLTRTLITFVGIVAQHTRNFKPAREGGPLYRQVGGYFPADHSQGAGKSQKAWHLAHLC